MADNGLYNSLMVKLLAGEISYEEELKLEKWMKESADNREETEALRATWNLLVVSEELDKIQEDAEWRKLQQLLEFDKAKIISINNRMPQSFSPEQGVIITKGFYKKLIAAVSVAASLFVVFALGNKLMESAAVKVPAKIIAEKPPAPAIMRHEENKFDHNITFLLNDGSGIMLNQKSDITFRKDFPADRRDIVLSGMAEFSVAHDKQRPFTVYSGELSTTALGTKFTVTAFKDDPLITVLLTEGKVVVKSVNKDNPAFKKDFILLPGQKLVYNKNKKTVEVKAVKSVAVARKSSPEPEINRNRPEIPNNFKGSWFMFNNQPLAKIFESLEEMYNIKIIYSRKDVEKMYFIGRFNKSDSLQQILKRIAALNRLSISRESDSFIIRSEEP